MSLSVKGQPWAPWAPWHDDTTNGVVSILLRGDFAQPGNDLIQGHDVIKVPLHVGGSHRLQEMISKLERIATWF